MNVLLDTCALLSLARGELPDRASSVLQTTQDAVVSSVSAWEVAINVAAGKLSLKHPPPEWFQALLARYHLREVQLDARLACAAAALPLIHRDPFDRVLVALAQAERLTILTSDKNIPRYPGIGVLW